MFFVGCIKYNITLYSMYLNNTMYVHKRHSRELHFLCPIVNFIDFFLNIIVEFSVLNISYVKRFLHFSPVFFLNWKHNYL